LSYSLEVFVVPLIVSFSFLVRPKRSFLQTVRLTTLRQWTSSIHNAQLRIRDRARGPRVERQLSPHATVVCRREIVAAVAREGDGNLIFSSKEVRFSNGFEGLLVLRWSTSQEVAACRAGRCESGLRSRKTRKGGTTCKRRNMR
jgi:hypothetical protein